MPEQPIAKDQSYSISELSKEFKVTPRTLRFYEEKGLLSPARNGSSRLYYAADRTRLRLILRGKRLGFSLDESAQIIMMYDPKHNNKTQLKKLIEKIHVKRDQLKQQQADLRATLKDLKHAESRCQDALAN